MKPSLCALTVILCSSAVAQQTAITGQIVDSSGGVIVNARVTLREEGGVKLSTITNNQGTYQFPSLRAAGYLLRVDAPGFTPVEKTVPLLLGQSMALDLTMRPAATNVTTDARMAGTLLARATRRRDKGRTLPDRSARRAV